MMSDGEKFSVQFLCSYEMAYRMLLLLRLGQLNENGIWEVNYRDSCNGSIGLGL